MRMLHTMLRVGNLDRSLAFYCDVLGMKLLRKHDFPGGRFTLAFVGYGDEASNTVLELTHNWDTEKYELGNAYGHVALGVEDIIHAVRTMRARGVEFMPTPASYYDMLPARLEAHKIGKLDEPVETLRDLSILVDGDGANQYLLQIFLKEPAGLYNEPAAGPFFFEIIQRKGDKGFGAGNFRALFESIEREQQRTGRL